MFCVFEDPAVAGLNPLVLSRPAFSLRCGALTLLERQVRSLERTCQGAFVRAELAEFTRLLAPDLIVNDPVRLAEAGQDSLFLVNARWLPPLDFQNGAGPGVGPAVGVVGEQLAWAQVPVREGLNFGVHNLSWWLGHWKRTLPNQPAGGLLMDYPWQLIEHNARALEEDGAWWQKTSEQLPVPPGVVVVGPPERVLIRPSARVEPLAFLDTTHGPVLIDEGALVQAFSRVEGPIYVGRGTQILAGKVRGSSFGPECRIGGEVEESIVQGYSNKAHDGFLGHSYLGEWVNFGAGSQTSDLRNDYGPVTLIQGGRRVETGLLKVGSFVGDHTKTSIGTLFNTGSMIGPFNQLATPGALLPRALPAFCQLIQGRLSERTDLGQMFNTATKVMARRKQQWTEAHTEFFLDLYERTAGERQQVLRENERRNQRRSVV